MNRRIPSGSDCIVEDDSSNIFIGNDVTSNAVLFLRKFFTSGSTIISHGVDKTVDQQVVISISVVSADGFTNSNISVRRDGVEIGSFVTSSGNCKLAIFGVTDSTTSVNPIYSLVLTSTSVNLIDASILTNVIG